MLWKILLTALVIAGAVLTLRMRNRPAEPVRRLGSVPRVRSSSFGLVRMLAAGFVVLMLLGAGFYLFQQWRDNYRIVDVRVIDSRTGNDSVYQAYKGDVEGRTFVTTDGRIVSLAETERLELGVTSETRIQGQGVR